MKAPAPRRDHVLRITGGMQLAGDICISGSKNAALPEMAAALLTSDPVRLNNVPKVTDTALMGEILTGLGGRCEGEGSVILKMARAADSHVPDDLGRRMRATIVLLGALLGRFGKARVPPGGGCPRGCAPGGARGPGSSLSPAGPTLAPAGTPPRGGSSVGIAAGRRI